MGSRRNIAIPFGTKKLEWPGYPMMKKFRRYIYSFWRNSRTYEYELLVSYLMLNDIMTLKSGLEVTLCHSEWYHSKDWVRFPIRFHSNCGSILHQFRYIARYWLFFHTLLHSAPQLGGFPSEYFHSVQQEKTRMAWLPDGEKISKIYLFVLAQLTNLRI